MENLSTPIETLCLKYFGINKNFYHIIEKKMPDYSELTDMFFINPDVSSVVNTNYIEIKKIDNIDNVIENIKNVKKKLSYVCALKTRDGKYVFLKRRTSFAYDKLINCYKSDSTNNLIDHCIRCIYYMGTYDRNRLKQKLTSQFYNIDPYRKHKITKRMLFLYFWRKFLIDVLNIFEKTTCYTNMILKILPGGKKLGSDNSIYNTISREVYEETGISGLNIDKYVAFIRIFDRKFGEYYENILFFSDIESGIENMHRTNYNNNNEIFGHEFIKIENEQSYNDHAIDLETILKIKQYIESCK